MLYYSHGLGEAFCNYADYFNGHQDGDAIAYLTLANKLIHEVNKNAITIAEEVSGMPGLATKYEDGGYGLLDQDDQGKERRRLASFFHLVGDDEPPC